VSVEDPPFIVARSIICCSSANLFPETAQHLMKLPLRCVVLFRQANRNASPIGVGRKGAADFDAPKTQRRREFGLRKTGMEKDEICVRGRVRQGEMVQNRNPFCPFGGCDLTYLPDVGRIGQCRRSRGNVQTPKRLCIPEGLFTQIPRQRKTAESRSQKMKVLQ
jgi:hypothetical protein